ncbi:cation diffusion facilitator CzcD-associated flavoprotein CzcO [Aminobacter aminovorans]|uniref:Trimethylamine monooxygenase n=1 Tax=Aminobacter aminovorans TaxID=83263 RepID=A0A380WJZ9_AMIAI|nr:NAD(P)/FAD-dependent oxidoreductase [Aminobacter aminovorans]TCS28732.1 cation diffusion facilitator CzcD-associated flavoprotein CzcO [Aminobacter aminovorans]SUU88586.1 FAD-containing monooxygenase EthA [Aminobacter aminovorans]
MVEKKKVCVIGAGVSGLAAAHAFRQRGHDVEIVERGNDLGGVWEPSRSYPDVQTQSPKDLYRYTSMPMPENYPEWPKGTQVQAYLKSYAEQNGLVPLIRYCTKVVSMQRRNGAKGWTVELEFGDGTTTTEDFDFVAVCTGNFSEKRELVHPGQDEFVAAGGQVLHSSEYTDPATVRGRRVVVLGFSKSATDIAVNAINSGAAAVTIVYLEPVWRIPYFIGGLINFKRILYVRAQEVMFPSWNQPLLARLAHAVAKPFVWANWRGLESLLSLQLKLKKTGLRPKVPIETSINCSVPIVTPGFFDMVADGRIKAIQGTIAAYEKDTVILSGGERVKADMAILAVGWKSGVPFLPEEYRRKLVEPDGQYRLYRVIANPDLPDMGFVGFNSSFCTVLSAELAANWLVRYADGKLGRQPTHQEMTDNIEMMLRWKRDERPAAGVYGGLCVAPYHFKHFDELLADIGATKRRRNALAENFAPPNADAYAGYLKSAPDYRAA